MATPVMLYIPNLIGYFRVACMVISFYLACGCTSGGPLACDTKNAPWELAIFVYTLNFAGDLVDGYAARAFNQCSKYGSVLDMVTDRTSTAGLCALLALLYPAEAFVYLSLIVLDIFSHWFHVVNAEALAKHHKAEQTSVFLTWYYGCYPLFAYCCVSQEFFYLSRWALRYSPELAMGPLSLAWASRYVFLPGCCMKQVVNVAQWWNAAGQLAEADRVAALASEKPRNPSPARSPSPRRTAKKRA